MTFDWGCNQISRIYRDSRQPENASENPIKVSENQKMLQKTQ
jgi:hypothetical protein